MSRLTPAVLIPVVGLSAIAYEDATPLSPMLPTASSKKLNSTPALKNLGPPPLLPSAFCPKRPDLLLRLPAGRVCAEVTEPAACCHFRRGEKDTKRIAYSPPSFLPS